MDSQHTEQSGDVGSGTGQGLLGLDTDTIRSLNQQSRQRFWLPCGGLGRNWVISPMALDCNDRGHIAWAAGRSILWLGQEIRVPSTLRGYNWRGFSLKLALTWWAEEAQIFVNGQLVQEGDLFDSSTRILLTESIQGGEVFWVNLRLVSPGHDPGALVRSVLEAERLGDPHQPEPSFIATELDLVSQYLQTYEPEALPHLQAQCQPLNLALGSAQMEAVDNTLGHLRDYLSQGWGAALKQRRISLLGHAHLDLAWLWPLSETWEVAERTFRSVLQLQQEFPELIFGHSSPVLYAWLEHHRPQLFEQIYQAIHRGTWETIAGLWVEPDTILPSGESLVRQILHGQRYVQEHLGVKNRVAWLPDSFGFSGQLPQLLKQGGIDWFITQKLTWNDTNPPPPPLFQWYGIDGTSILSLMSAPIGKGIDPREMVTQALSWEHATGLADYLWLPGVGDHGGGPSRDMLQTVRRWQTSPCCPELTFTRLQDYLTGLEQRITPQTLPQWSGDLYLELHRGCYTSHGDQKQFNRRLEGLLYRAELWATLADRLTGAPYPRLGLDQAWKRVLVNQFHDILPGSSIPQVFEEANYDWRSSQALAEDAFREALLSLAQHLTADLLPQTQEPQSLPILVVNSVAQTHPPRPDLLELPLEALGLGSFLDQPHPTQSWQARTATGAILEVQPNDTHLLIAPPPIPGVGYGVLWLEAVPQAPCPRAAPHHWILENAHLRAEVNPQTGTLESLCSPSSGRSFLQGPANQLQTFRDQGQYWDAWNIDPHYEQHPLPSPQVESCQWLEWGPLRQRIRVIYRFQTSVIQQDYCLDRDTPWLRVETQVDWQADQVLLKVAFPLALDSSLDPSVLDSLRCTTDMAAGVVERPVVPKDPREAAQWEIPCHRWLDLSVVTGEDPWGVLVLNDGKYGADVRGAQLRLTLLRSPHWPDPQCDRGLHRFAYAIYPHDGTGWDAQGFYYGQLFNLPWDWLRLDTCGTSQETSGTIAPKSALAPQAQLLDFGDSQGVLMALKPREAGQGYILRVHYQNDRQGVMNDRLWNSLMALGLQVVGPVNLLETPETTAEELEPRPWQIQTWHLATTH